MDSGDLHICLRGTVKIQTSVLLWVPTWNLGSVISLGHRYDEGHVSLICTCVGVCCMWDVEIVRCDIRRIDYCAKFI